MLRVGRHVGQAVVMFQAIKKPIFCVGFGISLPSLLNKMVESAMFYKI